MCSGYYRPIRANGSNITLIGVDFRDRVAGPAKLEKLLKKIQPDLVVHQYSGQDFEEITTVLRVVGEKIKEEVPRTEGVEEVLMKIYSLVVPFPIDVGNRYAWEQDRNVRYAMIPKFVRGRLNDTMTLAHQLYKESKEKGIIDTQTTWKINNEIQRYYGAPPTSEETQRYWKNLNNPTWKDVLTHYTHAFLIPERDREIRRMAQVIRSLAEEESTVVFPVRLDLAADRPGSLYRRVKNIGVKREALV
jgi:hypothetical protein